MSDKYNLIIVDKEDKKNNINSYLKGKDFKPIKILFVKHFPCEMEELPKSLVYNLDKISQEYSVKGVIISTDPLYHKQYAKWALKRDISILMDKPITAHKWISTDINISEKLNKDYEELYELYQKHKENVLFSIVSQRRFHRGFRKVKELIKEVFEETKCPITSIQVSHSDGQWRLPTEIVDIDYHSYNLGFGKVSHSGYHFLDIINYFFEAVESIKKVNNVDIYTNFLRPLDFMAQINLEDYSLLFKNFQKYNKYTKKQYDEKMKKFGEIDAFIKLAFKKDNRIITLGSINLIHNSFSQRGKVIPNKDLYKGNGRVRHETYTIQQGPFQCIQIASLQSREVKRDKKPKYTLGGEYHFDIHIFRNDRLIKKWKNYKKISIRNLQKSYFGGISRGHQEDSRRFATLEFLEYLEGKKKNEYCSDFTKHRDSVRLMAGIYKAAALKYNNKNSVINVKYEEEK